jgi:hypothetical protein
MTEQTCLLALLHFVLAILYVDELVDAERALSFFGFGVVIVAHVVLGFQRWDMRHEEDKENSKKTTPMRMAYYMLMMYHVLPFLGVALKDEPKITDVLAAVGYGSTASGIFDEIAYLPLGLHLLVGLDKEDILLHFVRALSIVISTFG